ncbi:accessory Sec system protein translocase subunit SecY2 [Leuconostoc suionicum]|uniref:accessory Sec system protein translocase subunit SecY2 n=1 Tax=Leuconostoc suionicum TaxID=1511761 RepID=UPI0021AA6B0E|nr:accessory Sec system protein translocase subunit SecY2 [Leuconostoc suionicum]MCT4383620.1 accessory Sec system protein translocase subunit SecY2 [Leuconostoc suionicum]MDC2806548.1 accessory Sec system protein translocase subunit SecY2 [Leuconostoc suionicum]MDC2824060.1 accessory Sec system protein translocase subunit SecY2 [Leuconostoc suionicum]
MKGKNIDNIHLLQKKISWTGLIIFIFLIGRNILIPGVNVKQLVNFFNNQYLLQTVSGATGGDLSRMSLFALGLGPWMSALILWRVLTLIRGFDFKKIPSERAFLYKIILAIVIGFIQSIAIVNNVEISKKISVFGHTEFGSILTISLIMVIGAVFLIWLSTMNEILGIGGPTILILASMIINWPENISMYFIENFRSGINNTAVIKTLVIAIGILFLVLLTVSFQRAQRKIPIRKIMINNDFYHKSYLPIQINPAGGMPLMYSMTLLVLPQYILQAVNYWMPNNNIVMYLIMNTTVTQPIGVTLYIIILFVLSIGFAFININPDQISEDLQQSGDYIDNVKPGEETRSYLTKIVFRLSSVGAIYMIAVAGCPLYFGGIDQQYTQYALTAGSVVILVSLIVNINDQITALLTKNNYSSLFFEE